MHITDSEKVFLFSQFLFAKTTHLAVFYSKIIYEAVLNHVVFSLYIRSLTVNHLTVYIYSFFCSLFSQSWIRTANIQSPSAMCLDWFFLVDSYVLLLSLNSNDLQQFPFWMRKPVAFIKVVLLWPWDFIHNSFVKLDGRHPVLPLNHFGSDFLKRKLLLTISIHAIHQSKNHEETESEHVVT